MKKIVQHITIEDILWGVFIGFIIISFWSLSFYIGWLVGGLI